MVNGERLITFVKPDDWSSTKGAEEDEPREPDIDTSGDSESEDNRPDVELEAKKRKRELPENLRAVRKEISAALWVYIESEESQVV